MIFKKTESNYRHYQISNEHINKISGCDIVNPMNYVNNILYEPCHKRYFSTKDIVK